MRAHPVSPRLFGRDEQLAELGQRLEAAAAGQGGMVLVAGEAGVGKSRLLSEALQTSEGRRCAQVRANCLEGDEAEPYSVARSLLLAAGGDAADVSIDPAPEAERQVRQVQQALLAQLEGARGAARPLVVVVDDVHWSDGPSLQVLLALALQRGPFLFLLTYRPQPPAPGLASFLAEASRLRLGTTMALQPLSTADTARMVRAMLDLKKTLPAGLLHEIMTVAEGIPFLVEELLHTYRQQGRLQAQEGGWHFRRAGAPAVPDSLRQAVEGRLLRQPRAIIAVAEQAAVLGAVVDEARLARLAGLEEGEIFGVLRALVEAQVLVKRDDGSIAFRHALTREAIRTRIPQAERQALHRRVALTLEAEGGSAASTLAYHWARGGDASRAGRHALRAAEGDAALHAHREAIAHYEMALAGGGGVADDGADGGAADGVGRREEILRAMGDQFHALGEHAQAIAYYEQAQAGYRAAGDRIAVAELDLRIGAAYGQQRERKAALTSLQAAFANLPADHAQRWRAGLELGLQQAASGQHAAAEATFGEALAAAPSADVAAPAADVVAGEETVARLRIGYELCGLQARRGDWASLEEAAQRALREAPGDSDEGLALRHDAHAALGAMAYYRGALQQTLAHFTACLEIAEVRGLLNDRALARWNLATNALYHMGRWHEARAHLARVQAMGMEGLVDAALTFEQWLDGAWEGAAERWLHSWPAMLQSGDLEVEMAFGRRIADVLLALERPGEALELLEPLLARMRQHEARSFELQLAPRQVEALAHLGGGQALAAAEAWLKLARTLGGRPAEGLLLRGRGLAQQQAGRWLEAYADFEAALDILEALPMPYEAARTRREAGLARLARGRRGDRQRGAVLLRGARQQFADLGAQRDESATEAILAAAGLTDGGERGPGPLTAREREVAQLVTEGLSNGEIAERLFITEKTAAYHVGNILNKLNFSSRVEIAVYMTRQE